MADTTHIDIDYLARLARLELSEDERARFSAQLEEILRHFESIRNVDVDNVEPTAHAVPLFNVWGEDCATPPIDRAEALRNAPEARDGQFVVPKVVDDSR